MVAFQSRFGREEWLTPYTLPTVQRLGKTCSRVDVICPGFAADCLETLEEIGDELRCAYQLENPDGAFHYIPALNDSDKAVAAYETDLTLWLEIHRTRPHIKAISSVDCRLKGGSEQD